MPCQYLFLDQTESTNAFLLDKPESERVGKVIYAREQTAGKGMGTNLWESAPGLNLTFSMGVDLSFLKAADQFLLSMAVPLGMIDVLDAIVERGMGSADSLMVKWPNDIVFRGQKLAGILINSTIRGDMMGVSAIGIGLNVNQIQFQDWPTHPISLKMILGHEVELEPLLRRLVESVDRRVQQLRSAEGVASIKKDYLDRLYRYRTWADYEIDGQKVRRFITGIDSFGRLETIDESGERFVYDIKEIKFV